MNEISSQGAPRRIEFYGRWALAFFAVFIVLVSWICNSMIAGKFGIMFRLGIGGAVVTAAIWSALLWATHQHIKQLEERTDD